ncbi:MAG: hypothetical protein ACOYOF_09035 [Verrucomicrobiaceae bacterium]
MFGQFYGTLIPVTANATMAWAERFNAPEANNHDAGMDICDARNGCVIISGYSADVDGFSRLTLTKQRMSDGRIYWRKFYKPRPAHFSGPMVRVDRFGNPFVVCRESANISGTYVLKFDGVTGNLLWKSPKMDRIGSQPQAFVVDVWGNPVLMLNVRNSATGNNPLLHLMRFNGANGVRTGLTWIVGYGQDMTTDNEGNFYVAGYRELRSGGQTYYWANALKFDASLATIGITDWRTFGTTFSRANSITPLADGSAVVFGVRIINGKPGLCTGRYLPNNIKVWEQFFPMTGYRNYDAFTANVDEQGNITVLAQGTADGKTTNDHVVVSYNPVGTIQWSRVIDGPGRGEDHPLALKSDALGNPIIVGSSKGTDQSLDYFATLLNGASKGTTLWQMSYNGPARLDDVARGAVVTRAGDVFITGSSAQRMEGSNTVWDMATVKIHNLGAP